MIAGVAGVFVGGRAVRMGGQAKGLMRGPEGGTLVARWTAMLNALDVPVVLVGDASAYAGTALHALEDQPPGIGPLGGLVALLRHAQAIGARAALALACDMPFVSPTLVERLLAASPEAPVLAPRRDARWEPLCARYDPGRVLPLAVALAASSHHSLQRLLDQAGAVELRLFPHEAGQLHDWDSPADVAPFIPGR